MVKRTARPRTVGEYILAAPKEARQKLRDLRACVRAAAPGATESLKWGMPSFSHKRILVCYAAFQRHVGFFPTPGPVRAFAKELKGYRTAKGSVQLPYEKPLPLGLIQRMVKFRVRECKEKDVKWKG